MSTETNPGSEPKQLSMEIRLVIAFVLMGIVIFATPYFYKTIAPPASKRQAAPVSAVKDEPAKPAAAATSDVSQAAATPSASAAAATEQTSVIDTDYYHVVISNRGAVVKSWTLKQFKDRAGKPLEMVNGAAVPKVGYPFAIDFRDTKVPVDLNQALYLVTQTGDGLGVSYEFSDGKVVSRKSFEFQKSGYLTKVSNEVEVAGKPVPSLLQWRGGFGDLAVQNAPGQQSDIHFDLSDSKLVRENAKTAKNGPVRTDGPFSFAGLEDQYFTAAFLPEGATTVQTTVYSDQVPTPFDKSDQAFVGTAIGGETRNRFSVFVGPKDIDVLRKVNPKLEQIVDFGWFAILAKPLFLVLRWLNNGFVHNYGWSIVIVTIVINILLFPLKLTNMKSMKKMQALQPQVAKINEKYKSLSMRDPKQAQKNQEMMDLYKQHGANPMGGCLPLLIQMPFLFAFYKVLAVSIEMRNASWLWVHDLSRPEDLAIHVLPILMILTGFVMQKMTPATTVDPNQQKMMQFMPLMMGFFFYSVQSGLVLYWLTGNLVGIAQQWFFNKTMIPAQASPPVQVLTGKKKGT